MRGNNGILDSRLMFSTTLPSFRDNVEWSDEQKQEAEKVIESNSGVKFSKEEIEKLETLQADNWDSFYGVHQNKFFKDRHWLFTEFPELAPKADVPERVYPKSDDIVVNQSTKVEQEVTSSRRIFELGSGVGNSEWIARHSYIKYPLNSVIFF